MQDRVCAHESPNIGVVLPGPQVYQAGGVVMSLGGELEDLLLYSILDLPVHEVLVVPLVGLAGGSAHSLGQVPVVVVGEGNRGCVSAHGCDFVFP